MKGYLKKEVNDQDQKRIEFLILIGFFFFHFFPSTSITAKFILLFTILLSCILEKSFHKINNIRFLALTSIIVVFLTVYHGMAVAKDYFIFCFGIISTLYFAKKYTFTGDIIYKYFIYIIIPLSIINLFTYNNVYYLPFTTGRVNIIGKDMTKHGTAIIGIVLFIGAIYNLLKLKRIAYCKDLIFLLIGLYLVAFSGSRSCLLTLLATAILYAINRKKYKKIITSIYFFGLIFLVFFMEYIQDYVYLINNEFILDLIGADSFKRHGVTSGRAWLWNYHWDCFINSPFLLGGGRVTTDFNLGDYIPFLRIKAPAASESPYTGMVACYGLFAFLQIGILVYLSAYAIKKRNILATCIIFVAIYNTTMGVNLTDVLHADTIFFYLLYYSSFKEIKYSNPKLLKKNIANFKD